MQGPAVEKLPKRVTTRQFIAIFIVIQIVVPAALLAVRWVTEGSQPFREYPMSWQMYSAVSNGEYTGVDVLGDETRLSSDLLPPIIRGQRYGDVVPLMLCEANPNLVSVRWVSAHPAHSEVSTAC